MSLQYNQPEYFAHARAAFWYGLQKLPIVVGQKILVPNYICDVILHPLENLGITALFYEINDDFSPDWDKLEVLQNQSHTSSLLLVHYFGQPQNVSRAQEFCKRHGIFLLEDNAHGYGGTLDGQQLGTFGNLGISSPRKLLLTPSGGVLYLNGKKVGLPKNQFPVYPVKIQIEYLRTWVSRFPRLKSWLRQTLRSEPNYSDPFLFTEPRLKNYVADPYSTQRILSEDWPAHAEARRETWRVWCNFVIDRGLQPLWLEPHKESCPWALPVYAKSQYDRLNWLRKGWRENYVFFPWPNLPEYILKSSIQSVGRWQKLFCIPLNQTPENFFKR